MIRVACPHCRRTYRTSTEGMGKTAVCTGCHQSFRIGEARPNFQWKSTDLGEDSWIGVEAPQEKKELKHCIICDAPLEEGAIKCLACGANQVTGIVHKSRRKVADLRTPFWTLIPIRLLIVLGVVALAGFGIYHFIHSMSVSVMASAEDMARLNVAKELAKRIAEGSDEYDLAERYRGRVKDANLASYVEMLKANDPMIRKAACWLIGWGDARHLEPIIALTKHPDLTLQETAQSTLHTIGARWLIALLSDDDASVRRVAAESLCAINQLKPATETIDQLAAPGPASDKIALLNEWCRPWPLATGTFMLVMNDRPAPFTVTVEQIGRTFYLQAGIGEFVSAADHERTFTIPVERWCAATGVAVDAHEVRNWMTGSITLASPLGVGWEGTARLTSKRRLTEPPPGFLPIASMEPDEVVTLPVQLVRPR